MLAGEVRERSDVIHCCACTCVLAVAQCSTVVSDAQDSRGIHTDLATGDLAILAGWKLKGLASLFFSGVAGVK